MSHLRQTCRRGNPCSILLIEDDLATGQLLKECAKMYEPGCYNLIQAVTIEDAGAKFGAILYDLVIVDLSLPCSDGISTFLTVRDMVAGRSPIAVLTGTDDPETELRCFESGAIAYVVKPIVSAEHFLRRCRGWILRHRRDLERWRQDNEIKGKLLDENSRLRDVEKVLREAERLPSAVTEVAEELFELARILGARTAQGKGYIGRT